MSLWHRLFGWFVDQDAPALEAPEDPGERPRHRSPPEGVGLTLLDVHPEVFSLPSTEGTVWEKLNEFRPSKSWVSFIKEVAESIRRDSASVPAWVRLVMFLGDSGWSELALIACLRAQKLARSTDALCALAGHRDLCLVHLGLAKFNTGPLVPIVDVGKPELINVFDEHLNIWLSRQLQPFGGNLEAAADHVVKIVLAAADT